MVGSFLDWENARGGEAVRAEARRARQGSHESVLAGDREELHQDRLGGHEQGNVRVSKHKISLGFVGVQHWTRASHVQRNITCGGCETRHLRGSVQQQEANSALGD